MAIRLPAFMRGLSSWANIDMLGGRAGLTAPGLGLEQRIRLEWCIVTFLLSACTFLLSYFGPHLGLERLDHTFYDRMLRLAVDVAPSEDIVIVGIDDGSIEQLGYWPWRRSVHAELLGKLTQARVVGLDIVLSDTNPMFAEDDQLLADAIRDHRFVVLPVVVHPDSVMIPLPPLQRAAADLGSINATLDSDGVVRAVQCSHATLEGVRADHFIIAMLRAAGQPEAAQAACPHPAGVRGIPFVGPPGSYPVYSYAQVLKGAVPPSAFADKYVLVGSWASALGDYFNVPSSESGRLMAGVEVLANGLQAAMQDNWIRQPGRLWMALLAVLPTLLACLMLRRLSPRRAFAMSILMLGLVFLLDWAVLRYAHVWLTPTASLLGVIFAYPTWAWRSQEAALKHMDSELEKLYGEKLLHGQLITDDRAADHDESLPARIIKLNKAIATLQQAIGQREQALRFLSHDMRSPQNAILALTQLQREAKQPLPMPYLLDRIEACAEKTLALVDGFVQLARAESMELALREVNLVDLLAQECDARWPQAQQQGASISLETAQSFAYVEADPGLLARMFGNLLDNAIKYGAGGAEPAVICRLTRDEADWVVSVRDNGRGITETQQQTLFEPFTRFGDDDPDNPPGSGLGLSFVLAVVKRHRGTIAVRSAPGKGSEFTVRLPALDNGDTGGVA